MTDAATSPLAQQLLDLQVAHHLEQLSGDALAATVSELATELLAAGGDARIADVVDEQVIAEIVRRALATVPGSKAVSEIVDLATTVLHEGPHEAHPLGEVVERERVEALLDAVLELHPALDRALDRLAESPLVATVASRFMARIVGEVVQANKAVAGKVPGLGSLVSLGSSAASRAMGAADKQVEALIGGTVGKGSTFAVRRLNRIVVDTVRDPTTREALLEIWDLVAQEPVSGLDRHLSRDQLAEVVDAGHALAVDAIGTDRAAQLADVVVTAFFERFGEHTPAQLLDGLGIDQDDVVADLVRLAPGVVDTLRESGELERMLRSRLEPFYASSEVAALLAGSSAPSRSSAGSASGTSSGT